MNKRLLLALALGALLVAGIFFVAQSGGDDTANQNQAADGPAASDTENAESNDGSQEEQQSQNEQEAGPEQKSPQPTARVSEKPEVYTAYGHVESNPVKQSQTTSTTCTTEPNTECTITFTNADTSETVTLAAKTSNSDGVAFWTWIGGEDVPSGTWLVTATAGDKTSDKETVYVE